MENKIKFRLPTKEEFENLNKSFSRGNQEKKGIEILNKKGDILFLAASGYIDGTLSNDVGSYGYYWSSTVNRRNNPYYLYFSITGKYIDIDYYSQDSGHVVRLVSDEPFEGCIEFGGVYWKTENEPGYYSWTEAMDKFNK